MIAGLRERLSEALLPSLGEAAVYQPADACLCGHDNRDPEVPMTWEAGIGEVCVYCMLYVLCDYADDDTAEAGGPFDLEAELDRYSREEEQRRRLAAQAPAEWIIPRGDPVDWLDARVLFRLWARWVAEDLLSIVVSFVHGVDPEHPDGSWWARLHYDAAIVEAPLVEICGRTLEEAFATAWLVLLDRRAGR